MKNKLTDLNNHLFAQLERLSDEELSQEGMEKELARTKAIVDLSGQIVSNAQLALDAAELVAKHGAGNWETMLPMVDSMPKAPGLPDYSEKGGK